MHLCLRCLEQKEFIVGSEIQIVQNAVFFPACYFICPLSSSLKNSKLVLIIQRVNVSVYGLLALLHGCGEYFCVPSYY